jgi:hypothetical protein
MGPHGNVPVPAGAPDPQIVVRLRHLQRTAGNAAVVRMLGGPAPTDRAAGGDEADGPAAPQAHP